jgi:hypothetical protein
LAGSYDLAPPEGRDSDSVLVEVTGPPAVDIEDNGTVNNSPYEINPDGSMTVGLDYTISGGDEFYNGIWIDYDYDFVTFNDTVEVTPAGTAGDFHYDLDIPDVEAGYEYYVAIRVYDDDAPNLYDTYAWMDPFMGGGTIVVVRGQYDTTVTQAFNAVKSDLTALGASYDELTYNQVSSWTVLQDYALVIWVRSDYYPSTFRPMSSTYASAMVNYIDNGGNVILMWPGPLYTQSTLMNRCGVQTASWWTSGSKSYSRMYSGYISYSGPGGTCNYFYQNVSRQPLMMPTSYMRGGYKGVLAWYASSSYLEGVSYDNGTAGDNMGWGVWVGGHDGWDTWSSTNPTSVTRKGVLHNIVESIDPGLI